MNTIELDTKTKVQMAVILLLYGTEDQQKEALEYINTAKIDRERQLVFIFPNTEKEGIINDQRPS